MYRWYLWPRSGGGQEAHWLNLHQENKNGTYIAGWWHHSVLPNSTWLYWGRSPRRPHPLSLSPWCCSGLGHYQFYASELRLWRCCSLWSRNWWSLKLIYFSFILQRFICSDSNYAPAGKRRTLFKSCWFAQTSGAHPLVLWYHQAGTRSSFGCLQDQQRLLPPWPSPPSHLPT